MTQTAEILEALPPVQMQPTGLAQFDLAVTATPLVINWNRDAVSALLDATLEQYEKLVVQEEDVPAIKSEMAGLNKLRDRLDNARSPARSPGRWKRSTPKPRRWSPASSKSVKA